MTDRVREYSLGVVGLFYLIHLGLLSVFFVPYRAALAWWLAGTYVVRMFGITAGYHRYFSHRSYKLGRVSQFLLAFLSQTSAQKGVLWWAAHHRWHHRYSDKAEDVHSPIRSGFWWAHVGWILSNRYDAYDPGAVQDLRRFPELRWLDRFHWIPPVVFGAAIFAIGGFPAFVWGFVFSTVVLYHGTFLINSLAHVWGTRPYATSDDSRNNFLLAILTLGEGWHNNHHYYQSSCRQGVRWWEVDITYYVIRLLGLLGITRDIRPFRPAALTKGTA